MAFLLVAFFSPPGFFHALYAAMVLLLIFGIKDLVIVNRRTAYQLLTFMLSFAGSLLLFGNFSAWGAPASFLSLAGFSVFWFWLLRAAPERQQASPLPLALAALVLFEIGATIFFLPISFFPQAALLFFASVLLFETAINLKSITARQAYLWGGGYAAISLLVVFLASWKV